MGKDDSPDLLIFKLRNDSKEVVSKIPEVQISAQGAPAEPVPEEEHAAASDESISPRGMKCTIHPWRQAYAVCSRCGLSFCYVDIIKKNGRFVCLDDIDKQDVEELDKSLTGNNIFTNGGGIMLLFNALALLYFFYPQAAVIYSEASHSLNANGLMLLFSRYYYPSITNLAAVIFSFLAGVYVLLKGSRYIGIFAGFLIFMLISYEYMSSSAALYLILIMAVSFICMVLFVLGNMSAVKAVNELANDEYKQIDWPRPEVF